MSRVKAVHKDKEVKLVCKAAQVPSALEETVDHQGQQEQRDKPAQVDCLAQWENKETLETLELLVLLVLLDLEEKEAL